MRTTTVVRNSLPLLYPQLGALELETAFQSHLTQTQTILESFLTEHGITTDNLVSQTDGDERATVRSWPDLETAQAWIDIVLSGTLEQGLDHPAVIVSAQVDPE